METYLIFNGNFFYIHSKTLLSIVVNGMTHCIDTCRLTLFYRKGRGLYSLFCNFGGFPNHIGDIFCKLYLFPKIYPPLLVVHTKIFNM